MVQPELTTQAADGAPCGPPAVAPSMDATSAARLAETARALADPVRLQVVDILRAHAGKVCVCDLQPLFPVSQSTLSHHLKRLRDAGIIDAERRGTWAYYFVRPGALDGLEAWLGQAPVGGPGTAAPTTVVSCE